MLIATWNVNSIRARLQRVSKWLATVKPDVLCMQELKVEEKDFPREDFEALGYHSAFACQRSYNGVGILSRLPIEEVLCGMPGAEDDPQARLIAATIGGIRVITAYVPNGQTVGSEKYKYKLRWMERFREHLAATYSPAQPLLFCGDFNVAPDDKDVYNPEGWRHTTLFHADVRNKLAKIEGWGFVDAVRIHHPEPGLYSWWDYRMLAFARGKGLRIDHIYVTKPLADLCIDSWIDKEQRKEFKNQGVPSDHAPVLARFKPLQETATPNPPVPHPQGSLF